MVLEKFDDSSWKKGEDGTGKNCSFRALSDGQPRQEIL